MTVPVHLPGYGWFGFLRNIPVRMGLYTGLCMSVIFAVWLVVANRVAFLEPFAMERNAAAVLLLGFFALLPVLRFFRSPWELLLSSLLGWTLLCLVYRLLALHFTLLEETYTAMHIFVLGAVLYLLSATLSWIFAILRRVRESHETHQSH